MPAWVTSGRGETLEDVAFLSGAALAQLHIVLGREDVPHALLRDRLALAAAEACVTFSGRPERSEALRDTLHLLRPGDLPGPAGEVYLCWRRAAERPVSVKALHRALPETAPDILPMSHPPQRNRRPPVRRPMAARPAVLTVVAVFLTVTVPPSPLAPSEPPTLSAILAAMPSPLTSEVRLPVAPPPPPI